MASPQNKPVTIGCRIFPILKSKTNRSGGKTMPFFPLNVDTAQKEQKRLV